MSGTGKVLEIETSPHLVSGSSVDIIMRNVVYALLPTAIFAIYLFGLGALLVLLTAVISCVLSEHLLCRASGRRSTIGDWSALITGLLYGLTLPPGLALWMVACGGMIAVALGKFLFGGLGYNAFNPALVGRAFLQAAFPGAMTTWSAALQPDRFIQIPASTLAFPFARPQYEGITSATPLAQMKFEQLSTGSSDLLLGFSSGSTGETSALLILLGGAWLVARNMMNWRIPVAIFATVAVLSFSFHSLDPERYAGPVFMLLSGGLMLGAVFMATDMVASPITAAGAVAYGVLIGLLVVVIRYWGGMPEGVMYALLLANACSPHISAMFQPRVFGTRARGAR